MEHIALPQVVGAFGFKLPAIFGNDLLGLQQPPLPQKPVGGGRCGVAPAFLLQVFQQFAHRGPGEGLPGPNQGLGHLIVQGPALADIGPVPGI